MKTNHTTWLTRNQRWEKPAVQQSYRERHPTIQENQPQRNRQPQKPDVRQQNSSRIVDQRQTSLERQQAVHQGNQCQQLENRE